MRTKSRKINIRNSLFIRIFLSILLISALSVLILTLGIFYWLNGKTIADINKANETMLLNTSSIFSTYEDFAKTYAMELYQNTNTKIIMFSGEREWNSRYSMAKNQIESTAAVDTLINSIYVFDRSGVALAASKSPVTNDSTNDLFKMMKTLNVEDSPVFWTMKATGNRSEVRVMTVFFHENLGNDGEFDGAVAVNIDMDILQKSIFTDKANVNQMLYVIDRKGNIVLQEPESDVNDITGEDYANKIFTRNSDSGSLTEQIDSRKYNISFAVSSDKRYAFISKMEYNQSIGELASAGNMILTITGLILFAIICSSIIISYLIYKPVGNVFLNIRKLFNDSGNKNTNMNEIQLTSDALAKITEKINTFEKDREISTVIKLITSENDTVSKVSADLLVKEGILNFTGNLYCIVIIRIANFKDFYSNNSLQALTFQFSTIRTIAEGYFENIAHVYSYQNSNDHVILIISEMEEGGGLSNIDIINSMKSAHDMILKSLGIHVTIGVSSASERMEDFGNKYSEAFHFTNYRVFLGCDSLVDAEILSGLDKSDIREGLIAAAIDSARRGSEIDFRSSLDRIMSECRNHIYDKSIKALVRLALAIHQIPNAIILEENVGTNPNYLDIHKEITGFSGCTELKEWFLQLFFNTSKLINDINSKKIYDTMYEIIEYINKHYSDPQLSVNAMAERLSISNSYFSKIFNDFAGCSFPDYINNIRLEKAKALLQKKPDMEINEIAQQVGYSINYFSIAFKKKYGVSPSKCRYIKGEKQ